MTNDAWFRFFPRDWTAGTSRMMPDEVGAYLLLILDYYNNGPLPTDTKLLIRISGIAAQDWARVWGVVGQKFSKGTDGKLHHDKCDSEIAWRSEQYAKRLNQTAAATATRMERNVERNEQRNVERNIGQNQNQNQNQSTEPKSEEESVSCARKAQKPTLPEVKLQCAKIGLPESEADNFINHYESNGWRVGRNPMKSWTHALQNWKKNWDERRYVQPNGKPISPAELVLKQRALERVEARLAEIRARKPLDGWKKTEPLYTELVTLKEERQKLMQELGLKA